MIIDVHVHPLDPIALRTRPSPPSYATTDGSSVRRVLDGRLESEYWGAGLSVERQLQEMDAAGIDISCILITERTRTQGGTSLPPEHIYENYLKPHPNRFIGFSGADPVANGRFNRAGLQAFRRNVEVLGFRGIKLLPVAQHMSPNDPRFYPYYTLAAELDTPIVMHQGMRIASGVAPNELARPYLVDSVLTDFPMLRLSVAHCGEPWEDELFGLMHKHEHLYTDLSSLCALGIHRLARNVATLKGMGLLHKVLWGSDTNCRPPAAYLAWMTERMNPTLTKMGYDTLTDDELSMILGENARRFLGLN